MPSRPTTFNPRLAAGFGVLALAILLGSSAQTEPDTRTLQDYPRLPIREGDRCLVSRAPLTEKTGVAILYRGRRVTVGVPYIQIFLDNPQPYFSKLQPRSALFQENGFRPSRANPGWLILGAWVAAGLVSGALCAHLALRNSLSPLRWFFAGLGLNLLGILLILRRPSAHRVTLPPGLAKIPATQPPARCPNCNAQNHPSAKRCAGCNGELRPRAESEVARAGLPS